MKILSLMNMPRGDFLTFIINGGINYVSLEKRNLKKEIIETKTVIDVSDTKKNRPQHLAEDVLEQIAGGAGWIKVFGNWSRSF
ncbi:XyeA family cyclophane-containing RiPP triceptide [Yersinia enterocolitica]|uniref:XyeA family cyclophane-containing RiPP triceptide n=1 Tax=Yersinia enterocolitica TaxID=630 RepID=UPI001E2A4A9B|nr:XyeA family cyclophane-containing RiPP triceptide [Yersinia enterocolitica]